MKKIIIELDEPNFDIAVERATNQAADAHYTTEEDEQDPIRELRFVGLTVEVRQGYGRGNHYTYEFEGKT